MVAQLSKLQPVLLIGLIDGDAEVEAWLARIATFNTARKQEEKENVSEETNYISVKRNMTVILVLDLGWGLAPVRFSSG